MKGRSLDALWRELVAGRLTVESLGTTGVYAAPGEGEWLSSMLSPRDQRGPIELVLGAAAELAAGEPLEALVSIQAAQAAGWSWRCWTGCCWGSAWMGRAASETSGRCGRRPGC
ncbi:MAG: hypothetical protein R3F43_18440 [bacterium]